MILIRRLNKTEIKGLNIINNYCTFSMEFWKNRFNKIANTLEIIENVSLLLTVGMLSHRFSRELSKPFFILFVFNLFIYA